MATPAGSTNPAPSTTITHGLDCEQHQSPLLTQCNATTMRSTNCRRRADLTHYSPDLLPVCKQHKHKQIRPGHCQAIAECGRRCDRVGKFNPPFHLCPKHADGTNTLPCYLLKLPAELRLMIWRYVLPETISAYGSRLPGWVEQGKKNILPLLLVNRQISKEALSVAYEQVPFEVEIEANGISACGKYCSTSDTHYSISEDSSAQEHLLFGLDFIGIGLSPVLGRIRNFSITINLNVATSEPIYLGTTVGWQAITKEEFYISQTRDKLKKFVNMIRRDTEEEGASNTIRGLELRLRFGERFNWGFDEMLAMVIMAVEPFKALGGVKNPALHDILSLPTHPRRPSSDLGRFDAEYQVYKSEWQTAMLQPVGIASQAHMGPSQSVVDQSKKEFRKIEEFVIFLHDQDMAVFADDFLWVGNASTRPFANIARVVHLARIANDQFDLHGLAKIRDVLVKRWADHQERLEHKNKRLANYLLSLVKGSKKLEAFLEHKDKLTAATGQKPRNITFDWNWPELFIRRFVTKRTSPIMEEGKTYTEDREYRYFHKDGKYHSAVLKTPLFVRHTSTRE
ncbi:hypothetical protein P171DRAFT_506251 [Karstenula rhodostoma CBS 690.94]|uniref:Uncharacterized protein n=1 Tax=Karstenula rhodostoma CBS 690.94 TaxID=1392251 RepID=A0A9P4P6F5_9PLEO|nr:hypothetical protein P171DRAFT_506251 [Karstenula rhodostoma CBS 690.94]